MLKLALQVIDMDYKANFKLGRYSYYFRNEELLFTVDIKLKFYVFVIDCYIYQNGREIISFREDNFLVGIRLKLINQSLPHFIELERKNIDSYYLKVANRVIYIKITYASFLMKNFGEFFIDGKSYGRVMKSTKFSETDFIFEFQDEENELNFYCMLLFAMHTVGYANIRW